MFDVYKLEPYYGSNDCILIKTFTTLIYENDY